MSAVPPDTHTLCKVPARNRVTQFVNKTDYFVPRNTRKLQSRVQSILSERVTMTNAAGLHFDTDLSRAGFRNVAMSDLELCSGRRNLRDLHCCYCNAYCCHGISFDFCGSRALRPFVPAR